MDRYMDFKAIGHIYTVFQQQLVDLPCTKGEIFQHQALGVLHKRIIFKLMRELVAVYTTVNAVHNDYNSTLELDKQNTLAPNSKSLQLYR